VQVSRGLVREGRLWSNRRTSPYELPEPNGPEARALSVAAAIAALVRSGARASLSGAYLSGIDLSNLDLQSVRFDESILAWTDLSRAKLNNASFKDADLEGAQFLNAKLVNADITVTLDRGPRTRQFNYMEEQIYRSKRMANAIGRRNLYWLQGPNFTCADMRGANLAGHPIVPMYPNALAETFQLISASFRRANIAGAQFSPLRGFGVVSLQRPAPPFPTTSRLVGNEPGDEYGTVEFLIDSQSAMSRDRSIYSDAVEKLLVVFVGSNWQSAKLDRSMRETLAGLRVSHHEYVEPCDAGR
jgi:uncharacterized protein YjbI with pentapeptide repeats